MPLEARLAKPVADMSDDEFDAWMIALSPAPGIDHIDDDSEDDRRAEGDLVAGRCHDHEIIKQWLLTAGHSGWKPFEEWLADRDG